MMWSGGVIVLALTLILTSGCLASASAPDLFTESSGSGTSATGAEKNAMLKAALNKGTIIEPLGVCRGSVIWLHGLGDTSAGFAELFRQYRFGGIRFVIPNAPLLPITLNGGMMMPAWFDIKSLDRRSSVDQEGIDRSAAIVRTLLDAEVERHNGDGTKVVLGGFSQGGALSSYTGLSYRPTLGHVIVTSGFFIPSTPLGEDTGRPPMTVMHGDDDQVVHLSWSQASFSVARDAGVSFTYSVEEGQGHEISAKQVDDFPLLFSSIFGAEATRPLSKSKL